jgi:hypothetical protein
MAQAPTKFIREEVIQCLFRTRPSNVPIAGRNSPSALRNRNSSSREAILTSPSVAPNAVTQGNQTVTETVATAMVIVDTVIAPLAKCSPLFVQNVARKLKYRLSLVKVGQCIAEIATTKSN